MTQRSATSDTENMNKRVRFDDNQDGTPKQGNATANQSPQGAAKASVRVYTASLQAMLLPIILTAGEHFVDRVHKLINKATQLQKMTEDEDFIPVPLA